MGLFRRFSDVGVTVVVATPDLPLVRASGLRAIELDDGRLGTSTVHIDG
jgi:ABC-type ATPase involved in cell division